jgi:Methylase involved in ubiquinone/menaquinone biosynthesis
MLIFNKIGHKFKALTERATEPAKAYNLWSERYDQQPDNLMLYLDGLIINELLKPTSIRNKNVLDFGCGTGRHWNNLYKNEPQKLIGVDISEGMLDVLKQKFPDAFVYQIKQNTLPEIADHSIDTIISTLTIAHIHDLQGIFATWDRILKPGGNLIITDFHPDLLKNGGKRVFTISGKTIRIRNYVHSIQSIENLARSYQLTIERKIEKYIDKTVKSFYEKQNALHVYEKYVGYPVIYGIHFKKK